MSFNSLESLVEKIKEVKSTLKSEGEVAVKAAAKELFDQCEGLKSIGWYQYTPYWNDGEPCYFTISGPFFIYEHEQEPFDRSCEEDGLWDWYEVGEYTLKSLKTMPKEIKDNLLRFRDILNVLDQNLEDVFGEHSDVRITRDIITIKEYDHE